MHFWKASCCEPAGVGINTLNLETMSLDEVSKAVAESAGFVIGSPTLGGHMPTQVTCQIPLLCSVPGNIAFLSGSLPSHAHLAATCLLK